MTLRRHLKDTPERYVTVAQDTQPEHLILHGTAFPPTRFHMEGDARACTARKELPHDRDLKASFKRRDRRCKVAFTLCQLSWPPVDCQGRRAAHQQHGPEPAKIHVSWLALLCFAADQPLRPLPERSEYQALVKIVRQMA